MKAKCPFCIEGCKKCINGFINIEFAEGIINYRYCKDCGRHNGGRISGSDLPLLPDKPEPCVFCGSENMEWVK